VVSKDGDASFKNKAPINDFLVSAYQHFQLNYPKFYKMDNLSKLGWLTAELLLQNSFNREDYQLEEIGIILANANSSLDDDLKYYDTMADVASPALFVYTLPNIVMGEISIRHGFKGEQAFSVQDAFNAEAIYQQVSYLLGNNLLQACICGWVDVLREDYKSVLFLVEKTKKENAVLFSAENMDKLFNTKVGE
jgi:dsDNA-binding SOS-regulon protein